MDRAFGIKAQQGVHRLQRLLHGNHRTCAAGAALTAWKGLPQVCGLPQQALQHLRPVHNAPLTVMFALNGNEPWRRPPQMYRAGQAELQHFPITGDGSCMFRAIVQGLQHATHGHPMPEESEAGAALNLRLAVVNELRKRRSEMEPFLPGITNDFDEYCSRMSHPQVWGGEPEMLMASHVMQRPISVYRPIRAGRVEIIVTYGDHYTAREAINLLWSGAHYDLLLPPGKQPEE